jgi:sec-independent protein translocase protein TatA
MPFNLGPTEMIFVMVVLLLLVGGKKLPEVGAGLGKGIREFKRSMNDIKSEIDMPEQQQQIRQPVRNQVAAPQTPPTVIGENTVTQQDGTIIR